MWLGGKGVPNVTGMNLGGTTEAQGVRFTMVQAEHSCGISDGDQILYGGVAAGYVIEFPGGLSVYYAGDTTVFGDMEIIGELYNPDVCFLPIGDFYTMSPKEAAYAIDLLDAEVVVPMHYGTFPVLTGTPDQSARARGRRCRGRRREARGHAQLNDVLPWLAFVGWRSRSSSRRT